MAVDQWKVDASPVVPVPDGTQPELHRIREVRDQQGISLRSVARRLNVDVSEARMMEEESADMCLSMLYRWQKALDVPVADLLVDQEEGLSAPVLKRARMVRLMKTAAAIHEKANDEPLRRLARMFVDQLVEIMPELKTVSPWHAVGQRRSLDECGRAAERTIPDDWFMQSGR